MSQRWIACMLWSVLITAAATAQVTKEDMERMDAMAIEMDKTAVRKPVRTRRIPTPVPKIALGSYDTPSRDNVHIEECVLPLMLRANGSSGYEDLAIFERCWILPDPEFGNLVMSVTQKTKSGMAREGIQWFQNPKVLAIKCDYREPQYAHVYFSFGDERENHVAGKFKFVYSAEMRKDEFEIRDSCAYEYHDYWLPAESEIQWFTKNWEKS